MAELYAPAPELYYAACSRIEAVRTSLDRWKAKESTPTSDPSHLIAVLQRGCERLRKLADQHLADWKAGQKDRLRIEESLAFLTASAAQLNSYLSIFEARSADRGMPEIALPLRLLLETIAPTSRSHSFIFFATHDFNFYYSDFYRAIQDPLLLSNPADAQAFLLNLPEHIALVAYSSIERHNILTLIILVHELSHYVDQVLQLRAGASGLSVDKTELESWFNEAKRLKYVPDVLVQQFGAPAKVPDEILEFYLRLMLMRELEAADVWVRELTADILAARIVGVGFFLTQKKFLGFFPGDDQEKYPPHYRRFWAIAEELLDPTEGVEGSGPKPGKGRSKGRESRSLRKALDALKEHHKAAGKTHISRAPAIDQASSTEEKRSFLRLLARDVIEKAIHSTMADIRKKVRALVPNDGRARISRRVFEVADLLSAGIAPCQNLKDATAQPPASFSVQEVLNGAWLAWIDGLEDGESPDKWTNRLAGVSRLALRGIELAHFVNSYEVTDRASWTKAFHALRRNRKKRDGSRSEGVLTRERLVGRLLAGNSSQRLTVTPINHPKQIGESSIDVRLGNEFFLVATTRAPSFEIGRRGARIPPSYYESHKLDIDESLLLHPGEFILGSTLEYLSLPLDVMAYVIGRSTLGRLGLIIATATHVAPGYRGTLTLELANVGKVPLQLKPGIRVAQLVFHGLSGRVSEGYSSHGHYAFAVGPEVPKI